VVSPIHRLYSHRYPRPAMWTILIKALGHRVLEVRHPHFRGCPTSVTKCDITDPPHPPTATQGSINSLVTRSQMNCTKMSWINLQFYADKIGRRRRRRKQLLDDLGEWRGYWKWKEEVIARTVCRTRFGGGLTLEYVTDKIVPKRL
jgi:hypothetical protein